MVDRLAQHCLCCCLELVPSDVKHDPVVTIALIAVLLRRAVKQRLYGCNVVLLSIGSVTGSPRENQIHRAGSFPLAHPPMQWSDRTAGHHHAIGGGGEAPMDERVFIA